MQAILGIFVLIALAWAISEDKRALRWRLIGGGLALQVILALLLLKIPGSPELFLVIARGVDALQTATEAGTSFVFGYIGGGALPFAETRPGQTFIFAFQALPLMLIVSALSALLFYWNILPRVVRGFAWLLQRSLGIGGPVGVGAALNVFIGMVEAPLLIKPYMNRLGRGELFMVMTCGMATIAGTMFALYATILGPILPGAAGHLIVASLISAPAAIMIAALMVPSGAEPSDDSLDIPPSEARSSMDAITRGTADGIPLLINVIAMLIVLVALVAIVNQILGLAPDLNGAPLSLERMASWLFAPIAWLIGIPWAEAQVAGELLGTKVILNELIAYSDMAALAPNALSDHSRVIMTYALCGFANFGSVGIMIGGLATICPDRRTEITALGLKSIIAGTLATCMTGALAGLIV
ncbi:MAG: NupC/NupG family nucleoside CNT transporter [Alphaproteobacteria bacterium]